MTDARQVRHADANALKKALQKRAQAAGFDAVGVTTPERVDQAGEGLMQYLAAGHHGDMDWLAATADRRRHPHALWRDARSIIMLGMNYGPSGDPLSVLKKRSHGAISVYARGRDYHDVVKGKLKQVAGWLHRETGEAVKVFVDTAPVMEKPLAAAAGIGWQGKHTNLVSRELGSWLFLGAIFTPALIPPDQPLADHCGSCHRCLDICPTKAFPAPYRLDARRCISYLTIEHKGHIPLEFRESIGNRIYGCDDCLAVCPWNKFAQISAEVKFKAKAVTDDPPLAILLGLDDAAFRAAFAGSPIKRTGRNRFIRNVLIAAGNSQDGSLIPQITGLLSDPSPVVRGAAVWALSRLVAHDKMTFASIKAAHYAAETDSDVRAEWERGPA